MSTYAVINISVVFFLLFYIYDTQTSAIIDLPSTTFLYVREIASGNFNENVFTIENGIALVFYLMLFRLSFKMAFALTRIYKDAGGSCNVK
ncbi:hypothetical protein AltI4_13660 [Alteromonas sp. I4]|nr:hypothetical protein AltI4_13660 [Alteromonas sp. I4]